MDNNIETDAVIDCECPALGTVDASVKIDPNLELAFPQHKRVFHQYVTESSGITELHLWFGDKQIIFDESELFPFGEQLIKQRSFIAGQAAQWGTGYSWYRVRELLDQLVSEGVLFPANDPEADAESCPVESLSLTLPPAPCISPRTWFECAEITRELTRLSVDVGYLEMILPIFRVAHIALDADGRQVGEANVFPKPLRVEVETDWRICRHAGSRFQNEKPMNVSAMKAMRKHWPQMMAVLIRIRKAFLERFPKIHGTWTVGDLERLSSVVLAVPAYLLMRTDQPVPNGQLHPVFSNLFRVTDGVRLTMHQMLFLPTMEATLRPDAPMTGAEIYAFVERNHGFISEHGTCAGPRVMIEEFLSVLVDGKTFEAFETVQLDPEVESGLERLQEAIDYGLLGLEIYAQVFSHWPSMARTYERLWSILEAWSSERSEFFIEFRNRFEKHIDFLRTRSLLRDDQWRDSRDLAYANMYENASLGLGEIEAVQTLAERIAAHSGQYSIQEADRLCAILGLRLFGNDSIANADIDRFTGALMVFLSQEQALVRAACATQQSINELLGRETPTKPFDAKGFDVYVQFQGEIERLPSLVEELQKEFAMNITVTGDLISIEAQTAV